MSMLANEKQSSRQRPHPPRPLQRVGHSGHTSALCLQRGQRPHAPRPPLLPRRRRRHPSHPVPAGLHGPQAERLRADTWLHLRFARLRDTAALLEIDPAQQLQQPRRAALVGLRQSWSGKVDLQLVVLAGAEQLCEQARKLWWG